MKNTCCLFKKYKWAIQTGNRTRNWKW